VALDFTLVLRAETAAAKAELEAAARGIQGVSTATDKATTASKAGATAAQGEAAARRAASQANQTYTRSTNMAAGATGNLVAQFNDIGMMMAAGQNPLQLAIQQGTQITQVIGPMGAAGAVKALGGALVGMINPISLITIGVIAASGYMLQWLTAAGPEVDAVTAALERQKAALEGIVDETERLRLARGMMLTGAQSQDEQIVLEEINRLTEARAAAQERLNSLTEMGGRAAGFAEQAAAARDVLSAEIAGYDAKIAALNAQREQNAQTAEALDLAGQVRSATAGIATALQAADGSNLQAAFSSAFPLASQLLGMAQGIVSTIGAAQAFQSAETGELSAQYAQYGAGRTIGERLARESGNLYGGKSVLPAVRVPGGAGGGGGGAARDEADALQELITSLEGEINALRTTNPIQQEMLRHREALAGATEAERRKVEDLIATRERERNVTEGLQNAAQMGGNALIDALMGADNAGQRLIETLLQAGLQAALLGEGPLAGLFGGGDSGGFLGMLVSAVSPKKLAGGGVVAGPGTATSDSIPAMLSNGEFVVNARATARNRVLLEAINAGGRVPAFANGGMVGGGRAPTPGAGGQRPMVQIINQSSEPIREEQGSGPDAEGTVTLIVGRAMNQGRFDRQQRNRYGLAPKVTPR
jgi:hypothetical protein